MRQRTSYGVSFQVQTVIHYVEAILADAVLRRAAGAERDRLRAGVRRWGQQGAWPSLNRIPLGERLVEDGTYAGVTIGNAQVYGARFQPLLRRTLHLILDAPADWLNPAFRDWMGDPLDPDALFAEYTTPGGGAPLAVLAGVTSCFGHARPINS